MKEEDLIIEGVSKGVYPKVVYKYRPLGEWTDNIFKTSSLWFATAESFNDPFDCNLSETMSHTIDDLQSYLVALNVSPIEYTRLSNLFATNPEQIRNICVEARRDSMNSKGILSLSKNHDNILMWSHYGKDHTGIVIGLDILEHPEFFLTPYVVKYKDQYDELNYFQDRMQTIRKNISTKAKLWTYEEEIRVLKEESKSYFFNKKCLKELYFGCRTPKEKINEIIALCRVNNFTDVSFFKARTNHGEFKLSFDQIA